jgi:hypothetical protein
VPKVLVRSATGRGARQVVVPAVGTIAPCPRRSRRKTPALLAIGDEQVQSVRTVVAEHEEPYSPMLAASVLNRAARRIEGGQDPVGVDGHAAGVLSDRRDRGSNKAALGAANCICFD